MGGWRSKSRCDGGEKRSFNSSLRKDQSGCDFFQRNRNAGSGGNQNLMYTTYIYIMGYITNFSYMLSIYIYLEGCVPSKIHRSSRSPNATFQAGQSYHLSKSPSLSAIPPTARWRKWLSPPTSIDPAKWKLEEDFLFEFDNSQGLC